MRIRIPDTCLHHCLVHMIFCSGISGQLPAGGGPIPHHPERAEQADDR